VSRIDPDPVARALEARGETLAVCETAAGGRIAAACLERPGASAWFVGGAVAYSRSARRGLLGLDGDAVRGLEPMSEAMILAFARATRERLGSDWAVAELGIAGPSPSPYGGPAGEAVIAVAGPLERATRVRTGTADRAANMAAFAAAALDLVAATVAEASA
jgi:PncC family amidohydrolase